MGFKKFDPEDLVISTDSVTATVWSNNVPTLVNFHLSSAQTSSPSGKFYYHVYQTASSDSSAAVQFDIAYCDSKGSGSEYYNDLVVGNSPTIFDFLLKLTSMINFKGLEQANYLIKH